MIKYSIVGLLVIFSFCIFGETKWLTLEEAKRECQGFSDCYNCNGVGFTTKSETKKVITDKGLKYITEKCYVACPDCAKRLKDEKSRIEAEKKACEAKIKEDKLRESKIKEDKLKEDKKANALKARICKIHKWCFVPRFGGDYYTESVKALFGANYMQALELEEKKLLKCSCDFLPKDITKETRENKIEILAMWYEVYGHGEFD